MEGATVSRKIDAHQSTLELLRSLSLLWLAGAALRLTILALPPVLHTVATEFRLRGVDIGILTAIPPFFFALAAIPGAALISRFGAVPSLLLGLLLNALGAAARGFTNDALELQLATCVMCLGVAIMQPAMPTLVRTWTPSRVGLATATYTFGLLCGEVAPAMWPVAPNLPMVSDGWRAVLFQWSLPVLATAVAIALLQPRKHRRPQTSRVRAWPNWGEPAIWKVGLLIGTVNAGYFGLNGFLPGWLAQAGAPGMIRQTLLALNAAQIPAALLLMIYLERLVFRRWTYVVAGLLLLAGSVGLVILPSSLAVFFASLAGFSLAGLLTLGLALPPLMTSSEGVPSFSAAAFTVSYSIAVLTALVLGALESNSSSRFISILPIAAAASSVLIIGTLIRPPSTKRGSD
jgi:MFS transporter, CP family, cyanate transporter